MPEQLAGAGPAADPPPGGTTMPWTPPDPLGPPLDPALGGPLLVTPASTAAGPARIATDALLAHSERLGRLAETLTADVDALGRLPTPGAGLLAGAPPAAGQSASLLDAAHAPLRAVAAVAIRAHDDLRFAIDRYSENEAAQRLRMLRLGEQLGVLLGPILRVLAVFGLPAIVAAALCGVPGPAQIAALRQWLLGNPELITSPAFVEAVRAGVMGMDAGVGSVLGLPPGSVEALAAAAGFTGVQSGAAYVIATGHALGLFRDGPVDVGRVSTTSAEAGPRGAVERLARVPEGDQVRIERYDAPGAAPRYIVYVGPTETFSPRAEGEPWDLTSNVTGVAGLSAGSVRATEAAMLDAGIEPSDRVQFVGFSQGGLVATRLAASGDWNAAGLETYGAPAGGIELPGDLAGLAVRNSDDFIPALAGPQLDHHLLQVERQAFAPGSPIPDELPAPAHQRSAYVATATQIDRAASEAVREQVAAMDAFTRDYTDRPGSTVTVMMYHAERGAAKAVGERVTNSGGSSP